MTMQHESKVYFTGKKMTQDNTKTKVSKNKRVISINLYIRNYNKLMDDKLLPCQ